MSNNSMSLRTSPQTGVAIPKRTGDRPVISLLAMAVVLLLLLSCVTPALAAEGNVTYSGDAGKFIFAPGSAYSPTDLFPEFKSVMPGDSVSQTITVKNDASNKVKVKIYIRALGAHLDSKEFLSQLHLRVEKAEEGAMATMFDAEADKRAQLNEWVLLGTLYSGGQLDLNVILDVPVELDDLFQEKVGYLDWEFMVIEYPIEPSDPQPPPTGDTFMPWLWGGLMAGSLLLVLFLLLAKKKKKKED